MPEFADLSVDLDAAAVTRAGEVLPVTDRSFELLRALVLRAPEVVAHRALLDAVWPGQVVTPETLKQRVLLLRQALGPAPGPADYIVSVHGRGYRLGYPIEAECADSGALWKRWLRVLVAAIAGAIVAWGVARLFDGEAPAPPAAVEPVEAPAVEAPRVPKPDEGQEPP